MPLGPTPTPAVPGTVAPDQDELMSHPLFNAVNLVLAEASAIGLVNDPPSVSTISDISSNKLNSNDMYTSTTGNIDEAGYNEYEKVYDRVDRDEAQFLEKMSDLWRFQPSRAEVAKSVLSTRFQEVKSKINAEFSIPATKARSTKKGSLPKAAVKILKKWLFSNFAHPYPSIFVKERLVAQTGLNPDQINYWFINARVRIWKPVVASMRAA